MSLRALLGTAAAIALIAASARAQAPAQPGQPQQPARPSVPQSPSITPQRLIDEQRVTPQPEQIMRAPAVLRLPGEAAVAVRRDLVYRTVDGKPLRFDLYLPPDRKGLLPAIVFASGASDTRGWGIYESYGRLAGAQDFAGIVYEKRYERSQVLEGVFDTEALLDHLRENGRELGIDGSRIVLWGFSGGGLLLSAGIHGQRSEVRALIGFYPALDLGSTLPFYGDSLQALARAKASPADILEKRPMALPPTLIARAGLDSPVLNSGITRFLRLALEANRPLEMINVARGRHAFDLLDDHEESRRAIRRAFAFAKEQTATSAATNGRP